MASGALIKRARAAISSLATRAATTAIPDSVRAALSGWGEAPQLGPSITMAMIQGALRTSENGDTYQLFSLFRDMVCNSSHVRTEFGKRILAVVGKPISIQPADKSVEDDVVAAQVCHDLVDNCDNWIWGLLFLQQATLWPVSAVEKIFAPVDGGEQWKFRYPVRYRVKKLYGVNYALYCYRVAYWSMRQSGIGTYPARSNIFQGTAPLYSQASGLGKDQTLVWDANDFEPDIRFYEVWENGLINFAIENTYRADPERHIIHRGNVNSGFRDTYGGEMRSLLFWWLLDTLGRDWFGSYMNKYGRPFVVAKANVSDKNLVDYLTKVFKDATTVSGGAVIVNKDAEIELKEAQVSGGADGFAKFIQICKDEQTKVILGQLLSTTTRNTGLGSGVAEFHSQVLDSYRQFDNKTLAATLVKQLFEPYLSLNGYRGRVRVSWGGLAESGMEVFTKSMANLKQAGYRPTDDALDWISEQVGFKVERDPEPQQQNGNANPDNSDRASED